MIDGIELAASGQDAYANVQETIARNLANANTVGFKKNMISFKTVLDGESRHPADRLRR